MKEKIMKVGDWVLSLSIQLLRVWLQGQETNKNLNFKLNLPLHLRLFQNNNRKKYNMFSLLAI